MRWVLELPEKQSTLAVVLNSYVLEAGKVHADDTPVPVQAPGSGKTRTGRLWVYVRDDRNTGVVNADSGVVRLLARPARGAHPQRRLAEYRGVRQADAYGGYDALYETGRITEAACLAHARRKIHDEHPRRPTELTAEALKRIAELYTIEADIRGRPEETRLVVRKEKSRSLMQWDALNVYCSDGRVEIDNNICENALLCAALGRRNCLFFSSERGGEAAEIIYSLLGYLQTERRGA